MASAICPVCKKGFKTFPSWQKRGTRNCSRACTKAETLELRKTYKVARPKSGVMTPLRWKITGEDRGAYFAQRASREFGQDGCWLWTGARLSSGYGVAYQYGGKKRKRQYAHRFSWELHRGPIPHGMFVLHRCDTPPCVNPDHLFLGTAKDNIRDCISKGRRYDQYLKGRCQAEQPRTQM